jgi:biopolymer transport protein ExbB/TolQ
LQQAVGALSNRDFDQAIAISGRNKRSPIARVVASGLASFQAAMPLPSDAEVIDIAKRALRRSATLVHGELKRGLNLLATIAATAPLIGAFGAVAGIVNSFPGCGAAASTCMAATADLLSKALVLAALGLLVAVPSVWCHKYLSSELEAFDIEMENESLELVNYLTIPLGQRK